MHRAGRCGPHKNWQGSHNFTLVAPIDPISIGSGESRRGPQVAQGTASIVEPHSQLWAFKGLESRWWDGDIISFDFRQAWWSSTVPRPKREQSVAVPLLPWLERIAEGRTLHLCQQLLLSISLRGTGRKRVDQTAIVTKKDSTNNIRIVL